MSKKKYVSARKDGHHISGFHSILSLSSYYAQIVDNNSIALGITKDQIDHIKNTKEMISAFEMVVNYLNPKAGRFRINLPFAEMTKSEIAKLADELNVPIEVTWSCLTNSDIHCGHCVQCEARKSAFKEAGVKDPTEYLS